MKHGFVKEGEGTLIPTCENCGLPLHIDSPFETRDRFGIITGLKFSPDSAYLIQHPEFDSNALCDPVP